MSIRELRDEVKALRARLSPSEPKTRIVWIEPHETEDQALDRLGVPSDERCELIFVRFSEGDSAL